MKLFNKKFQKITAGISAMSLIIQSLLPLSALNINRVYAEEASSSSETTLVTPTPTPQASISPTEEPIMGALSASVLKNVEAESLDLDSVDPSSSGTITTDKADYAPTDTAIISGSGFKHTHKYDL